MASEAESYKPKNWIEDFWTLTEYFACGMHVLFCAKTQSGLIAWQTDSNWAEQVLILLLGPSPGCNSQAVFSLLYHIETTSYNKLWQSLSRAVPSELSQLLKGNCWSVRGENHLQGELKTETELYWIIKDLGQWSLDSVQGISTACSEAPLARQEP